MGAEHRQGQPLLLGHRRGRALFDGRLGDPAVWQGSLIVTVLAIATVLLSARLFERAVR
ncbi:hypothetical protein ACFQX7_37000 [Luedemannella flava]